MASAWLGLTDAWVTTSSATPSRPSGPGTYSRFTWLQTATWGQERLLLGPVFELGPLLGAQGCQRRLVGGELFKGKESADCPNHRLMRAGRHQDDQPVPELATLPVGVFSHN